MNTDDINNILIELDILGKIEEDDKIRIRNMIEIDPPNYSRSFVRKLNGDNFERSIIYINDLIKKVRSICTTLITIEKCNRNEKMPDWMVKMNINNFVKDFVDQDMLKECYKFDPYFSSHLKNIEERLKVSITGLNNLIKTYKYDKNKVSQIENVINNINIQLGNCK